MMHGGTRQSLRLSSQPSSTPCRGRIEGRRRNWEKRGQSPFFPNFASVPQFDRFFEAAGADEVADHLRGKFRAAGLTFEGQFGFDNGAVELRPIVAGPQIVSTSELALTDVELNGEVLDGRRWF